METPYTEEDLRSLHEILYGAWDPKYPDDYEFTGEDYEEVDPYNLCRMPAEWPLPHCMRERLPGESICDFHKQAMMQEKLRIAWYERVNKTAY